MFKPRLWNGNSWLQRELTVLPGGLTLAELPAFTAAHGIPQDAQLTAVTEYDENGPEVALLWYTPVPDDQLTASQR